MAQGELIAILISSSFAASVITGIVQIILWKLNHRASVEAKKSHGEKALKLILFDRIKYLCKRHLSEGCINVEDLRDLVEMHTCYHNDLKGNGFLDNLMRQVNALPHRKEEGADGNEP
jgi:hypothetical protein